LKDLYSKALDGKTIAFLPMSLGAPLMDTWEYVIRTEAERSNMKYTVKDPGWNSTAQAQAFEGLIADKPDVIVVQNPNVQLLVKQIKQAQAAGIYVIQLSMMSNTLSDAYVGGDWIAQAEATGKEIVKDCGKGSGKSGKVVILQGELTAAQNVYMTNGLMKEFAKDPSINVVSSQATNWDATKAYDITTAVLQQHPDVCAIFGPYDIMTIGGAEAVKKAGLTGKVIVYSNGGGYREGCEAVKTGLIDKYLDWEAWNQGREVVVMAKDLLMAGEKPGSHSVASFSSYFWVTKDNIDQARCTDIPKKS
jgi:ribose transport system substrate-binding protein